MSYTIYIVSKSVLLTRSPCFSRWIALALFYVDDLHEAAVLALDRAQELQPAMQPESYASAHAVAG